MPKVRFPLSISTFSPARVLSKTWAGEKPTASFWISARTGPAWINIQSATASHPRAAGNLVKDRRITLNDGLGGITSPQLRTDRGTVATRITRVLRKMSSWAIVLAGVILPPKTSTASEIIIGSTSEPDLQDTFLAATLNVEQLLLADSARGLRAGAEGSAIRLVALARQCDGMVSVTRREERADCLLRAFVGSSGLEASTLADPILNSVTGALAHGRGSCDALVAFILGLSHELGDPFDAVILRDHVLLGCRTQPGVYFEVLEHGRRMGEPELRRYPMPPSGRPTRVRAKDYLPYHLDNLAARFAATGDTARAEAALQFALNLAPKPARFRYNAGTLLLRLGRHEEALDQLRIAIRRGWDNADAWVNRGIAEWKLGQPRDARLSFARAIKEEPGNPRATANLLAVEAELRAKTHP